MDFIWAGELSRSSFSSKSLILLETGYLGFDFFLKKTFPIFKDG